MSYSAARYHKASELLEQIMAASTAADGVVDRYFKSHRNMGSTDRRFAAATVYGCLRRRRELLAMVAAVAPDAQQIDLTPARLLVGVYLLVNDAWLAADFEQTGFEPYARLYEVALKTFDRTRLTEAERLNLPDWLHGSLSQQLQGAELERSAEALSQVATVDLRVNLRQVTRAQLLAALNQLDADTQLTPFSSGGLRRSSRGPLQNTQAFKRARGV